MRRVYLFEKLSESLQEIPVISRGIAITLLLWAAGMISWTTKSTLSVDPFSTKNDWDASLPIALILVMFGLFFAARPFIRSILKGLEPQYPAADAFSMSGKRVLGSIALFICLAVSTTLHAQSGRAFRDFNGDGVQTGAEPGVQGINVSLYANATLPAKDQLIGTAITDASGNFNFATALVSGRAANAGERVRVEFSIPSSFDCSLEEHVDFEGIAGAVFGTSVQFITGQQANIRFAINYPGEWVQNTNPDVILPCYAFGNPDVPGNNVSGDPSLVTFKYQWHGIPAGHTNGQAGVQGPSMLATIGEVGSLYGVAFSRQAQKSFASATLRRHCALGPLGPGGIYIADANAVGPVKTVPFVNLDAIGIQTWDHNQVAYPPNPGNNTSPVTGYVGSNTERGIPGISNTPSTDYASGDQVGKVSIGDIDISTDGRYLYVVNLWDRRVYEIDLVTPRNPQAPTLANVATRVRSWAIPDPGTLASQGEHRPWGLKFHRGKLYVGVVLSGQNLAGDVVSPVINGNGSELRGYVYEFNPATAVFSSPLLNFSFVYGRERPWIPWGYRAGFPSRYFSGTEREIAEPIIADIEFDDQGNMLVGIMDRKGNQYGINTNDYAGNFQNYEYASAGELLRANASVVNGSCVYNIVTRPGTADYYNDNLFHSESVQGPLAVLPGAGDVMAVWLDPVQIRSGGTMRLNNTTGAQVPNSGYEVFEDLFTLSQPGATVSKANGLGDIELTASDAPLELGNRIWADFDNDGIQDSGEPGLANVPVQLKTAGGVLLATTTTSATGTYSFTTANVPDGDPTVAGNQPGPQANTTYIICIPASAFGNGQPLNGFLVSPPNEVGTGLPEFSDSDGILLGNGDVAITLTTGIPGDNNYTFDFGVIPTDYGDLPDTYGTTEANNGASHWVSTALKLGACVDGEIDGQPEAMAGLMTGGDDNTVGIALGDACTGNGDDENGIIFDSPMVPGATSCVLVTAMNMTGAPAFLQGWIDFNGNGTFEAGEQLTTGDFAASGAVIPAGGVVSQHFCFTVPATATFQGGVAFSRFRLSAAGGLTSGGAGGFGEVEDYKINLAKVGNFVWNDYNNDGIQNEPGTSGINGVTVQLTWAGPDGSLATTADNRIYTDVTIASGGVNGKYDFCGLIPGNYSMSVPVSPAGLPTLLNVGSDVTDSDDPAGVAFTVPVNFILPTGENGTGDNPGGTNGFPDVRDNLTFDFGYIGLDYGDLPNTYGTTESTQGPAHVVTPDLYLGTCIDAEQDGQPEAMAGLMTGGDDGSVGNGTQGTCATAGDDENGIVFTTPMVSGSTACIRVTAHNNTDEDAILQGWIDFNGNGTFEAAEELNTLDFAGSGAVIPDGGVTNQQFCFTVPAGATFTGGQAMVRFRLSPDGDLTPGNPVGSTPPLGEVEDYKNPLTKVGNLVWWDVNNNGQQDAGEVGLNNVPVQLTWYGPNGVAGGGDDVTYTVTTSNMGSDGMYMFLGLTPGNYSINIPNNPPGFSPTTPNVGNDYTDSDVPGGQPFTVPNPPTTLPTGENGIGDVPNDPNFPDNQNDLTIDFGFIALDYGDLPDTYGTTTGANGPAHLLDPNLYLGTCVDGETNGQPEPMAGLMVGGDDNNSNAVARLGTCITGDDENGIVLFETPLVPGYSACVRVTAVNTTGSNAILQGWIDFNGNGTFEAGEQLTTSNFAPAGAVIPNGGVANQLMCFQVPAGATFNGGQAMVRFRLSPNGGLTPNGPGAGPYPIGEVEDYKVAVAKIGSFVWNDNNNDGLQNEPGTNGINGVTVQLVWGGPDGNIATTGDNVIYTTTTAAMNGNNGQYMFWGLIPGTYSVLIPTAPPGFVPTQLNQGGNENLDADTPTGTTVIIPVLPGLPLGENGTGDTPGGFNGFPDGQDNLQIDFGFVALDFGDLPDTYGTTDASAADGAVHTVNPTVMLGSSVDSELDGQPDSMAGLMTGGDDNNNGGYNEGGVGDDENGIVFESPMIPGNQACIRVNAINTTTQPVVLQMWIDFNGDGDVADAGEAVTTGSFNGAGGGAAVPAGGLTNAQLCFQVPATATFTGGAAFVRFRISPAGNLPANGPENMPFPIGEVEDYKLPLTKVGNYVWNDNNNDGIQNEPGSNGLNNVTVQLLWFGPNGVAGGGDDVTYTVVTSNMNGTNGQYMFLGLTPGNYSLSIPTPPPGFIPTQVNQGGNDVTDSDIPGGQTFTIPNPPTTLPTGENGTGDVPNDPNFPDNQNDLTLDFGFVSVDYGDLPNSYGTTIGNGGPKHIVNPNLKLGASVDGELDGQPEAMAGMNTGGDDGNNGGYNEGGAGDDENGVIFLTPMIPGFQACVRVNTMNTLGGNAVLQAWIDFNGDGDVLDAGEQLNTGSFAAAAPGAIVPPGASVNSDFCFDVPADATFFGGQAFTRFRLSPTGGLSSTGPAAMPYPIGEVEDHKVLFAKAGNLVWIDANVDGLQTQPLETPLGINGVTVELQWAGPDGNFATTVDNRVYTDVTATENGIQGKYMFCGLIPGNYRMVVPPFGYVPTLIIDAAGNTQDVIDSDNPAGVNFTVPNPPTTLPTNENGIGDTPLVINGFPDNQANFTFDFGYLGFDFGDAPESYGTTQGANNPGPDGAVHTVTPDLYLGTCVDIDIDGQPEAMAGFMTGGDDGNAGPGVLGTCAVAGDDENGITFPTPLIPGNTACVKVTARNNTGGPAFLQAWIDFNGNGVFDTNEQLTTGSFAPAGASIPNGGVTAQNFCFDVPATATFNGGNMFARFRLSKNGGLIATGPAIPGNGVFPNGEVEDYKLPLALIGNYVWMDNPDIEGDQDATEMPLPNVQIDLVFAGEDGIFQTPVNSATAAGDDRVYVTTTNANGYYEFRGLIPSTNYRILPHKYTAANGVAGALINPLNKILTIPNLPANDNQDSDGTPLILVNIPNLTNVLLPTGENGLQDDALTGFPDNQTNVSLDFGFIEEPKIAAAMAIVGFQETSCGHFGVIMDVCIKNSSTAPLASLQAVLDLAGPTAYGSAFLGMIGQPEIISSSAQQNPGLNTGFNGTSTPGKNLLDGTSGLIWPGEQVCIRVRFDVDPLAPGAPAAPKAQAVVSGRAQNFQGVPIPDYWNGGAQYVATDLSDGGNDPLSNNPDAPGNTGGFNDPTPLGNCWQTTQHLVCDDFVNISIGPDCLAYLTPSGLLEGEDEDCAEEDFPLGGFFKVTLTTQQGVPVPNPVPLSYLGQTLKFSVKHIMTCNSCWGNFKTEDKLTPVVVCEDIHLNCAITKYDPAYLDAVLDIDAAYPEISECSNYTSNYIDTWHDLACNEGFNGVPDLSAYVERKWQVTDQYGNSSSCVQYIYFHRLHVLDVFYPQDAIVSCSSPSTDPSVTGAPYVNFNGQQWPLWPASGFCEMSVTYTDQVIPVCDGTHKIERTWRIHDWCSPTSPFPPLYNPFYFIQIITVMDNQGPAIACPANTTVSIDPFKCCATVDLPDAIITDNCSRVNNINAMIQPYDYYTGLPGTMVTAGGILTDFAGNNYWAPDTMGSWGYTPCLPLGTHTVTYRAQDDCGNTGTCQFQLTVADLVPPVATCDETTTIGLNFDDPFDCYTPEDGCDGAGVTWVPAKNFDDGSHDACSQLKFTIRRMAPYSACIDSLSHEPCYPGGKSEYELATAEGDSIKFYCCEAGTIQTVILRVYQVDYNGNFINGIDGEPLYNECMIQAEVQDKIKPICSAPAHVTVACEQFDPSLWLYGKAQVLDNCCLDDTKVYQEQCGLTHSVSYTQFDTVCNKGTIIRTFRAFDCHGQTSQCTQRVVVNYNQDYFVKFPNDVIVTVCDGTGNYGEPIYFGEDCELLGATYQDAIFTVVPDACFKIERTWKIINWCTFNSNLPCINVPNPNPAAISNAAANLAGPTVSRCGTLAPWAPTVVKINPTDAVATNFCTFWDANANCYIYKQIIKIIDGVAPTVVGGCPTVDTICDITANNNQLWNDMPWWDNTNQSHDLCEAPADICVTATDACSGSNINIEYQLFLDLDGDGVMETIINSINTGIAGLGWNAVPFGNASGGAGTIRTFDGRPVNANQKYGFAIQETISGNNKTACVRFNTQQAQGTFVPAELPYGTHKIKWFISDGCGNESVCEYTIIVKDCKAPTVVCHHGLSVNIMPGGMIGMWDTDFLQYTEDNCTQTQYLKTAIRKCGQGTGFPVDANGQPIKSVLFTCAELGQQCVEIWSIDLAGNADYCQTYIDVQDNNGNCAPNGTITVSGALKTEISDGVEEATVEIAGSVDLGTPFTFNDGTDNLGVYQVTNSVPLAADFTITPIKDDNPLNGVTTYDLVLISKHILGVQPLGSPYKMIAADANKSNSITTFDIVELRKLILGIYQELPSNTSWRFVEKSHVFANPQNPFTAPIPENVSMAQALTHQFGHDFVGVKIGDVNNTVVANNLMSAEDRSAGTLLFDLNERDVKAGEVFEVSFKAADKTQGYQMTLNLKGLEVAEIVGSDNVAENNFGVFNDGLTVSVDGSDVFTVTFRATKSGKLSNMMTVSSRITKAEAYTMQNERVDVGLRFNSDKGSTISGLGFELYQNQPNPFVNKTSIGFHLPEATAATLTVFDETGRMVYSQKGDFAKGYNVFNIERQLITTNGALWYRVETSTDSATRTMIQTK